MLRALRNVAIIALLALVLTVLPAGGNVADGHARGAVAASSLGAIGAARWSASGARAACTRDAMTDRQRGLIYGASARSP